MRPIYPDLALRHGFLNDSCDVLDYLLLHRLHLREYLFDGVSELQNLKVQLIVHVILILNLHILLHQHEAPVTLIGQSRHLMFKSLHHMNEFVG